MTKIPKFTLPDTFWRISAKALIYDGAGRLLVFKDKRGEWEIPGGGWEHSETFDQCIRRELAEEINAKIASIEKVAFCYIGEYKYRNDKNIHGIQRLALQQE